MSPTKTRKATLVAVIMALSAPIKAKKAQKNASSLPLPQQVRRKRKVLIRHLIVTLHGVMPAGSVQLPTRPIIRKMNLKLHLKE